MSNQASEAILGLTAQIVSAHVAHNKMEVHALPPLIESVFQTLSSVEQGNAPEATEPVKAPAVPIKKSVFPDYIVCLEDGRKMKMLKRHLKTSYDMTPEQYRARWNLPKDYPMVAPTYASRRSTLAKQIGLGRKPSDPETHDADPSPNPEPAVTKVAARRARGAKA